MARSDLLVSLVRAGAAGNPAQFRKVTEALIAEERSKQHSLLADKMAEELHRGLAETNGRPSPQAGPSLEIVAELTPRRRLDDLLLPRDTRQLIEELIEENHRADLLRSHGLEPRHRILFTGPPGNGKTSLAEAISCELMKPFLVVRYESLIGSYLGETASRLRKLFDYVRTRPCVLFFDEFDTLGKERGDVHDTGEIKRVVSSLLLQIDDLPSFVCVITATNHPELLDRAVWRRFQVRVALPPPTRAAVIVYLQRASEKLSLPLGLSPRTIADKLGQISFGELEEFVTGLARRRVLRLPDPDMREIASACLTHWQHRVRS